MGSSLTSSGYSCPCYCRTSRGRGTEAGNQDCTAFLLTVNKAYWEYINTRYDSNWRNPGVILYQYWLNLCEPWGCLSSPKKTSWKWLQRSSENTPPEWRGSKYKKIMLVTCRVTWSERLMIWWRTKTEKRTPKENKLTHAVSGGPPFWQDAKWLILWTSSVLPPGTTAEYRF